ncbi:MAG: class I SAM-dependent methyltransferase [Lysobacterales bacterium]
MNVRNREIGTRLLQHAQGIVLDIGCADRWVERSLPSHCLYYGCDSAVTGKDIYGAQPHFFADAKQLPILDDAADTVVLLEVLEHLREPRVALMEIVRVLKPLGVLILTMPFLYPMHDEPHDYQRYTAHGLAREMEHAGLTMERIGPSLGSSATAGLIACIAMAGAAHEAVQRRSMSLILLPLIAVGIFATNCLAWAAEKLLPSWPSATAGYHLIARKP